MKPMLIYSMSVSVDGFIADREGGFDGPSLTRSSFVSTSRGHASSAASCAAAGFTRRSWYGRRIRRCATTNSGPRSPTSGARSRRSSSAARSTASRATRGSPRRRWPRRPPRRSTRLTRTSRSAAGRVFAALTDPDALARARLARPKRDTGRHFRSDTQCERLARRPSRAWFGRPASVSRPVPVPRGARNHAEAVARERRLGAPVVVPERVRPDVSGAPALRLARNAHADGPDPRLLEHEWDATITGARLLLLQCARESWRRSSPSRRDRHRDRHPPASAAWHWGFPRLEPRHACAGTSGPRRRG
jgi:hypothetical protein